MSALTMARRALLASVILYAAALVLGVLSSGTAEAAFLLAIGSVAGIALSALACVLLQIGAALRRRSATADPSPRRP